MLTMLLDFYECEIFIIKGKSIKVMEDVDIKL